MRIIRFCFIVHKRITRRTDLFSRLDVRSKILKSRLHINTVSRIRQIADPLPRPADCQKEPAPFSVNIEIRPAVA